MVVQAGCGRGVVSDRLAEIEAALKETGTEKADEWEYSDADWLIYCDPRIETPKETWTSNAHTESAYGPFIVAAHNDYIPWLIAEVKRLRANQYPG